jgi:hypothetical protein
VTLVLSHGKFASLTPATGRQTIAEAQSRLVSNILQKGCGFVSRVKYQFRHAGLDPASTQ